MLDCKVNIYIVNQMLIAGNLQGIQGRRPAAGDKARYGYGNGLNWDGLRASVNTFFL